MGVCFSVGVRRSTTLQGSLRCGICGKSASQLYERLPPEDRDQWVSLQGSPCHRCCAVADQLQAAEWQHERASYQRAKRAVYPLPHEQLQGSKLHSVDEGLEWAASGSFHLPYTPSPSVAKLQRQSGDWGTLSEPDGLTERSSAGVSAATPTDRQSVSSRRSSIESSLAGEQFTSNGTCQPGSPSDQRNGTNGAAQCHAVLRRPSPIHHPALLEVKTLRRLSGVHPAFDRSAMQRDADGTGGKEWRDHQVSLIAERLHYEDAHVRAAAQRYGFD